MNQNNNDKAKIKSQSAWHSADPLGKCWFSRTVFVFRTHLLPFLSCSTSPAENSSSLSRALKAPERGPRWELSSVLSRAPSYIQLLPRQDEGLRLLHLQGPSRRPASLKPSGVGPVPLTQGTLVFCEYCDLSLMGIGPGCAPPSVGPLYFLPTEHSPFPPGSEVLALPAPRPASPAPLPLAGEAPRPIWPRQGGCMWPPFQQEAS